MLLKRLAIESDLAENGLEAVNKVADETNHYDILLMDNLMPVMVTLLTLVQNM